MSTSDSTANSAPVTSRLGRFITDMLLLARPEQWAKNILVVPIVLIDVREWRWDTFERLGWAVGAFILASSLVYVINDISDLARDRLHPTKRFRPVAAGRITVPVALFYAVFLAFALLAVLIMVPVSVCWPILAYLCLNVAYSRKLKHVPLIDVFTVATGFVLRALLGYLAVGQQLSEWLLIAVFASCLLLSLGKRRQELAVGEDHRPALRGYSTQFADQLIMLTAALTITAGMIYLSTQAALPFRALTMLVSTPCALFAVFRYLQILMINQGGGNPARILLRDRTMITNSLLWAVLLGSTVAAHRLGLPF